MNERAALYEKACCDAGWTAGPLQDFIYYWKARADKAEAEFIACGDTPCRCSHDVARYVSELRAMLESEREAHCKTIDERNAARAEVAALKARKVKIGAITSPSFYGDIECCAFHRGVMACADAIRAAGVEVV